MASFDPEPSLTPPLDGLRVDAVFGDVGVALIAVFNAMRILKK